MRIRQALGKIQGTKKRISSESAAMYSQDFDSLVYWVFMSGTGVRGNNRSVQYKLVRSTKDWKVDKE